MHLRFRNVNDAFYRIIHEFHLHNQQPPRTYLNLPVVRERYKNPNGEGEVLRVREPVLMTYQRPTERVLLNEARDANPFFHLYEAMWMLAGRNDVAPLSYYTSGVGRYSDDGVTMNGAYGWRWRHADDLRPCQDKEANYECDQLDLIVNHLRSSPESRRAVLSMWNVEDDLLKVDTSKDVCCNLNVMFSIREYKGSESTPADDFLDMTVTNRSNDAVLGLLGANYVQFTVLQEYLAACLGVEVGVYHHFTNNLHVYLNDKWKPEEWLVEYGPRDMHSPEGFDWDQARSVALAPVAEDYPESIDRQIRRFVESHKDQGGFRHEAIRNWSSPFLAGVAEPALTAYHLYRLRGAGRDSYAIGHWLSEIEDDAWRLACANWLKRRQK